MLSAYRRAGLVIALAILASVASVAARPSTHPVAVPAIARLIGGTGWHVRSVQQSGWDKMPWKQWQLYSQRGTTAALYVEATNAVKRVMHWTGELGYLGEGYVVLQRYETTTPLSDGRSAPITVALVRRGADRQIIEYAYVSQDGIEAQGTDDFFRTAWRTLRGDSGMYYLVRVAVPAPSDDALARAVAAQLLKPVLPRLSRDI